MPFLELGEHRVDQLGALVQRLARDGEHQLRVARRPVVVHPELAGVDAALAQRHALGVPERHDGVHPPGDQARHGREADRHAAHALEARRRRAPPPRAGPRRPTAGPSRPRGGPRGRAGGAPPSRWRSRPPAGAAPAPRRPRCRSRARARAPGHGCPPPTCPRGRRRAASGSPCSRTARGCGGSRPRRSRRARRSAGSRAPASRARGPPPPSSPPQPARHASSANRERNLRTAANSTAGTA